MQKQFITYKPELRKLWSEKKQQILWQNEYPQIFDENDLTLAKSQYHYHFGEWCAAIHYAKQGYNVLVEKYLYPKSHPGKWQKASGILTPAQIEFLKHPVPRHQAPDLLVYKDNKLKFFVEVKTDYDKFGDSQRECFENIEKYFKCKVILCEVKKDKGSNM